MPRDRQTEIDYDDAPHAGPFDYEDDMPDPSPLPTPTPGVPWYKDRAFFAAVLILLGTLLSNWNTSGLDTKAADLAGKVEAVDAKQAETAVRVKAIEADVKELRGRRPLVFASDFHKWQRGPLPPDTYGFGGVVPAGQDFHGGFFFADFQGDKVVTVPDGKTLKPADVAWFNNSLTLPPAYEKK